MKKSDFNYNLPEELIAQHPIINRDQSRLMVLNRQDNTIQHKHFKDLVDFLNPGDCLVINETKVMPARLYGHRPGKEEMIEVLLLNNTEKKWETLVKPGRKMKIGTEIIFSERLCGKVIDITDDGNRIIELEFDGILEEILDELGEMPLPPYIREKLQDKDRYQTVYAHNYGSAAAPTAGLHFTEDLLKELENKGIKIAKLTLHVGLGTFRPVKEDEIEDHKMHKEHYTLDEKNANIINDTKSKGNKVYAVGTTSVRTLESICKKFNHIQADQDDTDIFIYPGYKFMAVDGLITNFHLPESTLLMLVSAFYDRDRIIEAYEEAIKEKYRFFSFGDAMLIR